MNKITIGFIISFLASFSTLFGTFLIFIPSKYQDRIISFSLAFSAGVMIIISFFSLIPEAFHYLARNFSFIVVAIFFVVGIIISSSIDFLISKKQNNNTLYRLGLISILVLILHNIPEGITSFLTTTSNVKLGLTLSLGIALHNIPEGIAIAIPIYYSTFNKWKAINYTAISGFSELLGAILAYIFLIRYLNFFLIGIILIITAGVMFHISVYELLPNSIKYNSDEFAIIGFFSGIVLMLITLIIL